MKDTTSHIEEDKITSLNNEHQWQDIMNPNNPIPRNPRNDLVMKNPSTNMTSHPVQAPDHLNSLKNNQMNLNTQKDHTGLTLSSTPTMI